MRDDAASQYSSDAIAGIVNIKLRETGNQGTFRTQVGPTIEGDGTNYMTTLNYSFKLGKEKSFLNFTLHYQVLGKTNRSDYCRVRIYSATKGIDDSMRAARKFYPATDSFKKVKGYGFFRNANSNPRIYPDGYVPIFPAEEDQDYSAVVGVTRTVLNSWNMDFSTG